MTDQFVAEVRCFPFNFPPLAWAFCQGQILPISQNTALFSLLGTTYGGNGQTTFALPDLQGRVALHPNPPNGAPGLSQRFLGEESGTETTTLLQSEIPAHTHVASALDATGDNPVPTGNVLARYPGAYQTSAGGLQPMAFQSLPIAGGDLPHTNMMPYLTFNFCIALQGIFPPRS